MVIAISTDNNNVKAPVASHFGRCKWFCLFDTEKKECRFVENMFLAQSEQAGSDVADFLMKQGVGIVIAGRFGSKVINLFMKHNIQMVIPESVKTLTKIINQLNIE
nr:NifB/NifX family molybdenum-iron cluster-binding protein [uncultured Bacteroides sp.]